MIVPPETYPSHRGAHATASPASEKVYPLGREEEQKQAQEASRRGSVPPTRDGWMPCFSMFLLSPRGSIDLGCHASFVSLERDSCAVFLTSSCRCMSLVLEMLFFLPRPLLLFLASLPILPHDTYVFRVTATELGDMLHMASCGGMPFGSSLRVRDRGPKDTRVQTLRCKLESLARVQPGFTSYYPYARGSRFRVGICTEVWASGLTVASQSNTGG